MLQLGTDEVITIVPVNPCNMIMVLKCDLDALITSTCSMFPEFYPFVKFDNASAGRGGPSRVQPPVTPYGP